MGRFMMGTCYILIFISLCAFSEGFRELRNSSPSPDEGRDPELTALMDELEMFMAEAEEGEDYEDAGPQLEDAARSPVPQSRSGYQRNVVSQLPEIQAWMVNNIQRMREEFARLLAANAENFDKMSNRGKRSSSPRPFVRVLHLLAPQGPSQGLSLLARFQVFCLRQLKLWFGLTQDDMNTLWQNEMEVWPAPEPAEPFVPEEPPEVFNMDTCPYPDTNVEEPCDTNALYRTIDGSCNNLQNPLWGRSLRPLARFLPPDYADGISEPRVDRQHDPLPSARFISSNLFEGTNFESPVQTLITMVFGQFLDHDLGLTAISTVSTDPSGVGDVQNVECGSGCETDGTENEACFPITVPSTDPFFSEQECLMFVRSQEAPAEGCRMGAREQVNLLTSYLDASMVYGSTQEQLDRIRDFTDTSRGRMAVTPNADPNLRPLLPQTDEDPECEATSEEERCFVAGDERVNEQVGLTGMHTIWVRYHNYIEEQLHERNPHWSGEQLFQESRRLLNAVWQYIVFNEFLPIALGTDKVQEFELEIDSPDDYPGYDPTVRVDVANVFQTAAFRFGHTLIPTQFKLSSNNFGNEDCIFLSQGLGNVEQIYNNEGPGASGVDNLMTAQVSQSAFKQDNRFTEQITRHLFTPNPPSGVGTDLPALNLQRGRDHGIPGYVKWREWCGLDVPHSFFQLRDMHWTTRFRLKRLYRNVQDIDLFAGGISETPVSGGLVGPTFACIIGRQFRNLRIADRFWFERQNVNTALSEAQIAEVRRMTLAKILCLTLDDVDTIQRRTLLQPYSVLSENVGGRRYELYKYTRLYDGEGNERGSCDDLPDIDFSVWTE